MAAAYLGGLAVLAAVAIGVAVFALGCLLMRGIHKIKHAVERKHGAFCLFKSPAAKPIQLEMISDPAPAGDM